MSRPVLRLLTVAAAAAAAVGLPPFRARHVGVSSPGATQGGFGVLTFRMPNEVDNANATELKVQLPADAPLASVAVKPIPGWSYTVTQAKLATPLKDDDGNTVTDYPSVIDWKATAGGIKPGEYVDFDLSVGPLPKVPTMTFKAIQTYSDGNRVSWIDVPAAGSSEEPEHPAPTLQLAAAGPAAPATAPGPSAAAAPAATASGADASKGSVTGAYVVGGIGLVAGLAALALAIRPAAADYRGGVPPARLHLDRSVVSPSSTTAPASADERPRRGSRVPRGFLAAAVAALLGVGGLLAGARGQATDTTTATGAPAAPSLSGTTVGDLTITDAYIRQPASPVVAAAYLTVRNDGGTADRLSSAYCGAATTTTVHADSADMAAGEDAPGTPWRSRRTPSSASPPGRVTSCSTSSPARSRPVTP